jgi:hypothetical protein
VRLGYRIPLKVAHYARETESGVGLHIDNNRQLDTSNSDITRVIENVKDLITKEMNIEVAHELSLQLHRGRKGSRRTSICTRIVEDTI